MKQLSLPLAHALEHRTGHILGNVDNEALDGLIAHAVDLLIEHLGRTDLEFISLAAHRLNEDGEVHLPSAADAEGIRGVGVLDAQRDVAQQFTIQPVTQVAGRDELALLSRKRRIVDREDHLHRGIGDLDKCNGIDAVGCADGIADIDLFQSREADDIARRGALAGDAVEPLDLIQIDDLAAHGDLGVIVVAGDDVRAHFGDAALHSADADPANILVVVNGRDQNLQGSRLVHLEGRELRENGIKKRR